MISKNCNRDTAAFVVLNSDWPAVKEHLEGKLKLKIGSNKQDTKVDRASVKTRIRREFLSYREE